MSFYGTIYSDLIPKDHLLRRISSTVDFRFVGPLAADCYCPDNGRKSWDPALLFKMVFLQFLYDLSDREVEDQTNLHLACKWLANYYQTHGIWRGRPIAEETGGANYEVNVNATIWGRNLRHTTIHRDVNVKEGIVQGVIMGQKQTLGIIDKMVR